jgi:hypothetical protein
MCFTIASSEEILPKKKNFLPKDSIDSSEETDQFFRRNSSEETDTVER